MGLYKRLHWGFVAYCLSVEIFPRWWCCRAVQETACVVAAGFRSVTAWHFGFFATVTYLEGLSCSCLFYRACCPVVAALFTARHRTVRRRCCLELVRETTPRFRCVVPFDHIFPRQCAAVWYCARGYTGTSLCNASWSQLSSEVTLPCTSTLPLAVAVWSFMASLFLSL